MLMLGWKAKAELLRTVLLTAGHQVAKKLPEGLGKVLDLYRRVHETRDPNSIAEESLDLHRRVHENEVRDQRLLWEPSEIAGWKIRASFYLDDADKLWWLFHAQRKSPRAPADKDIQILYKVLEHMGCDPARRVIIGPESGPGTEYEALPFGWWTWPNTFPLLEMQIKKDGKKVHTRVVPSGTRPTDGFQHIDLKPGGPADEPA